jgi:hypothetical protein
VRKQLLDELLTIQQSLNQELISDLEVRLIREQWMRDSLEDTWREIEKSQSPSVTEAGAPKI